MRSVRVDMKNITDNLLHWAWHTTRFLGILEKARRSCTGESVKELEQKFLKQLKQEKSIKNTEFPLLNPGYLVMFSYALLVLPSEVMKKENTTTDDFVFNTINLFNFILPINSGKLTSGQFLKKMRNAISHTHFKLEVNSKNKSSLFSFWNINTNGSENFRVTISHENYWKFLDEIGKYYSAKVGKP